MIAFVALRLSSANERIELARTEGYAAFEAEEWPVAIKNLNQYVRKRGDDLDALYKLAVARRNQPHPRGAHISQSIVLFRQLRDKDRGNTEARRHLLELYRMAGQSTEGLALAEEALASDSKDFTALKTKAFSEFRLRKFSEALTTAKRGTEIKPDDIELQMLTLATMRQLKLPNSELIARGEALLKEDPENPRLQLVMGLAHMLSNDRAKASELYRRAAAAEIKDRDFALLLIRQMDQAALFTEAVELTQRMADDLDDEGLRRSLVHRLFQVGRVEDAMAKLDDIEEVPSDLLGLKAMILKRQKKVEESKKVQDQLSARAKGDGAARAWEYIFDLIDKSDQPAPSKAIEIYQRAVQADPSNPYIRDMLARLFLQTQEAENARDQWTVAAQLAPSWAAPYVGLAEMYAARNQPRKAMEMSQGALLRSPRNPGVVLRFIRSMEAMVVGGKIEDPKEAVAKLLQLVEQFQEQSPGEPSTFGTYLRMLSLSGDESKAKAKAKLEAMLADPEQVKRFDQKGMLAIAAISATNEWGLEDKIMATLQEQVGETPMLAYANALKIARKDRQAGIAYMQKRVEAQPVSAIEWQAQWGRFLEALDDARAASVWKALGEQHVNNPNVQQLVLKAPSVQSDRDFVETTIDRLKKATGEDATGWKLARARFLLSSNDESAAQEAVSLLLPIVRGTVGLVEPHLLLAVGYEQVGNLTGAVEELSKVRSLQPDNPAVLVQLAKLQMRLNSTDKVAVLVDQVLAHPEATPSQQREAAGMLAQLGELEKALAVMNGGVAIEKGDYLLAQLYLRANQRNNAIAELEKLLENNPSLPVIVSYATLQRAIGKENQAIGALARLKQLNLEAGVREIALAEYHAKFGEADRAMEYLVEATKAQRTQRAAYRKIVDMRIEAGDIDEAMKVAKEAKSKVVGDPVFSLLTSHEALVRRSAERKQMIPILLAIVRSAGYRDSAVQILQMVDTAAEKKTPAAETIRQVRDVADQNPRFRQLQYLLADFYAITGRYDEAASVATRAMRAFPNDAAAAERAFNALARLQRWAEALSSAREWQSRQANNPSVADRAIARAYIGLKQPLDAIKQLQPYRQAALKNPQSYADWISIYAESLIKAGRTTEAESLLKTLIGQHPIWRGIWVRLAMNSITDPRISSTWLERVGKVTPKDSPREWLTLGSAWIALGRKFNQPPLVEIGMDILTTLHESLPDNADIGLSLAVNAQQENQIDVAERVYGDVLKANPENVVALNNLAMLYVDQNSKLDRALELAQRAVKLKPKVGSFHDTLAEVYLKRNEPDQAVAALKIAVAEDPDSIDWKVNLLAAHIEANQSEEARRLLGEIDRQSVGLTISERTRDKIKALREKVAKIASGS